MKKITNCRKCGCTSLIITMEGDVKCTACEFINISADGAEHVPVTVIEEVQPENKLFIFSWAGTKKQFDLLFNK